MEIPAAATFQDFIDAKGVNHGWWLNAGTLLQLDFPHSTFTQATGENNKGLVVGTYQDSSGASHGFVYNTKTGKYTSVDNPAGIGVTGACAVDPAKNVLDNHALYLEPRAGMMQDWADYLDLARRGVKVFPRRHKVA